MSPAEKAFRQLREYWFDKMLRQRLSPFESHDDEREQLVDDYNFSMKAKYDQDTEAILEGQDRCINPCCFKEIKGKIL